MEKYSWFLNEARTSPHRKISSLFAVYSKELGAKAVKERLLNGILTFCAKFQTKNIIV